MHSYLSDVYSNDYETFINVSAQDNVTAVEQLELLKRCVGDNQLTS